MNLHCKMFGHELEKFIQFTVEPKEVNGVIDYAGCDEGYENYKKHIIGFVCHKCGVVKNYTHNFSRLKEMK